MPCMWLSTSHMSCCLTEFLKNTRAIVITDDRTYEAPRNEATSPRSLPGRGLTMMPSFTACALESLFAASTKDMFAEPRPSGSLLWELLTLGPSLGWGDWGRLSGRGVAYTDPKEKKAGKRGMFLPGDVDRTTCQSRGCWTEGGQRW